MNNEDAIVANTLHAGSAYLERMSQPAEAVVVIGVTPKATLAIWMPGNPHTWPLPIDDAGAELCEAAAPAVQAMFEKLSPSARELAAETAATESTKLQLLVLPAVAELRLRLVVGSREVLLVQAHVGVDA